MSATTLPRIDVDKNMRRFYRKADLFDEWCIIHEWHRIGCAGPVPTVSYATPTDAHAVMERQRQARERRGYV